MSQHRHTRKRLGRVSAAIALLATIGFAAGCGRGEEEEEEFEDPASAWEATHFTVLPDAKPFFGPTPFTVKFSAEVKNAQGKVKWEWAFGDGATAAVQNPEHTFTKPGLYTVGVAGTDEKTGERDGGAVIVRAMTDEEVAKANAAKKAAGVEDE